MIRLRDYTPRRSEEKDRRRSIHIEPFTKFNYISEGLVVRLIPANNLIIQTDIASFSQEIIKYEQIEIDVRIDATGNGGSQIVLTVGGKSLFNIIIENNSFCIKTNIKWLAVDNLRAILEKSKARILRDILQVLNNLAPSNPNPSRTKISFLSSVYEETDSYSDEDLDEQINEFIKIYTEKYGKAPPDVVLDSFKHGLKVQLGDLVANTFNKHTDDYMRGVKGVTGPIKNTLLLGALASTSEIQFREFCQKVINADVNTHTVDIEEKRLRFFGENAKNRAVGDVLFLPYLSNSMDVVFSNHLIHSFEGVDGVELGENISLLALEAYRVLRKGGTLNLEESIPIEMIDNAGSEDPMEKFAEMIFDALKTAGFSSISISNTTENTPKGYRLKRLTSLHIVAIK